MVMKIRARGIRAIGVSAALAFGGLLAVAPQPASAAPTNCPPGQPPDRPPGQPGNNANAAGSNGNGGQQGRTPPGRPPDRPPAYPPGKCELGESSSSTAAGRPVTFSGSGYQSGETVAMGLNDGTSLGTVTADPSGS